MSQLSPIDQRKGGPTEPSVTVAFSSLRPEAQLDHRARLALRVMAILGEFWTDDSTPDAVRAIQIEGWLDVVQELSEAELRQAWANYQRTGPRTERHKLQKPDAGALRDMAMRARAATVHAKTKPPPEPERVISPEEMAQRREFAQGVMERLGFAKSAKPIHTGPRRETVTEEDMAEMRNLLAGKYGT